MSWRDLADGLIELPVATSWSRVGPALRRRIDRWRPLESYDLGGRVIALTGATSGLGLAAASQLARCRADLLLVARDRTKADGVRSRLVAESGNARIEVVVADLADLGSVRAAAAEILARRTRLDVLIHNAGALSRERREAPGGTELTVAAHVLGPFLLTSLLFDRLRASAPARVVTMSSGGMYTQPLTVSRIQMLDEPYNGAVVYARAKRAQVTLNQMWAKRTRGSGVVFSALHPGWADTPGLQESLPGFRRVTRPFLRTPEEGADTMVWLAADDGAPLASSGRFWLDRRPRAIHRLARTRRSDTPAQRERLWRWCEERSGLTGGPPSSAEQADRG